VNNSASQFFANPAPVIATEPPQPSHPPNSVSTGPEGPGRRPLVVGGIVLLVVALVGLGIWKLAGRSRTQEATGTVATVTRGDFVRTLRVQGTVEAVSFHSVAAPRLSGPGSGALVVTKLIGSGTRVKKGDLLVEFDRQTQIKNALDRQADFVDFEQQIRKMQADQSVARATDSTALKQAEGTLQTASLELRRNEIVSKIDAEKNQQTYEEAKATLEQLRTTFDLKRKAAQAELRSLEIQRDRAKSAMEYAQNNTQKLLIKSPIEGIVVLNSIWKGGQMGEVAEGDEVRPGVPFLQVVNSNKMQVRSRVNQADIALLQAGTPVKIGLDAYPELSFPGTIDRIAAIGVTSNMSQKVRTFQAVFAVEGSDAKLMPDLSAAVDIQIEKLPNVLTVPRDAITWEGSDAYVNTESGEKKKVQVKTYNEEQAVIEGGVETGMRVRRNGGGR
jgi:HlyD family secretion protein